METYRVRFSAKAQASPRFDKMIDELLEIGVWWQTGKVDCTSQLLLSEAVEVIRIAGSFEIAGEIIPT